MDLSHLLNQARQEDGDIGSSPKDHTIFPEEELHNFPEEELRNRN
jgi:hypothetical protein